MPAHLHAPNSGGGSWAVSPGVRLWHCIKSTLVAAQDPNARDRHGNVVVVAVGAHYRPQAITREDLMLHIVNVRSCAYHLMPLYPGDVQSSPCHASWALHLLLQV